MADNVIMNVGTGGATLATDEIALIHHQLVKIEFGQADSATMVSTTNGLPVDLRTNNLSGNLNVSVATALPAGGATIGNVGVISMVPGVTPTALGKAEDDPHATGDVGVQLLAVRTDTPVNRSGLDGDYEPLQVSAGRLWTSTLLTGSIPAGGNNIGDVDVLTLPSIPAGNANIGDVDIASLPNEGQQNMAGSISIAIASDQTAIPVSDGGGSLTVDGSVSITGTVTVASHAVTNAGTFAVQESGAALTALQLIDDPVLVDDIAFVPATTKVMMVGFEFDDTTPDSVDEGDAGAARMSSNRNQYIQIRDMTVERSAQVTATNALKVDNSAVTQPISGTVTANAGTGNFVTVGEVAHDGADTGAPQKIGAQARQTWPTPVADVDRANLVCDDVGRLVTYPFAPRDLIDQNRIALTSTAETTLLTQVAGTFLDLVSLDISNESSTEVRIDIRDATTGTVRWSIDLAADGGGIAKTWTLPFKQSTVNANWTAQLSAAVSTVYVMAQAIRNV